MTRTRSAGAATFVLLLSSAGCARRDAGPASDRDASAPALPPPPPLSIVDDTSGPVAIGPPAPPPVEAPLRVIVGGDLLPHRPSLAEPKAIADALAPLAPLFAEAHAVVANYEAATGLIGAKASRLAYAASPDWLAALPQAGIKAVTVANNHACDLGEAGLSGTIAAAEAAHVVTIGADAKDPWEPRVVAEAAGKRVCAVAWTTIVNSEGSCATSSRLAVARARASSKPRIERAVARSRAECDATIAIVHGGEEYKPQTTLVMDQAAHAAEAGADAVVIHHPHVPSPIVLHPTKDGRTVPIFASVGNLVTNQGESWKPPMFPVMPDNRRLVCVNGWTRLGVLADLAFKFDKGTTTLEWHSHLVWVDNEHADDRNVMVPHITARLLDPEKDRGIVERLSDDRRGPIGLFDDPCWSERAGASLSNRCTLSRPSAPSLTSHPGRAARRKK